MDTSKNENPIKEAHNQNVDSPLPLVINNQYIIDTHYATTGRIINTKKKNDEGKIN